MKKIFMVLLLVCTSARATPGQDSWGDPHEKIHWIGAYGLGVLSSAYIDNKALAFGVAEIPLIARELWKEKHGFSHFQPSRNVADTVGAALGIYTEHCLISLKSVSCQVEF